MLNLVFLFSGLFDLITLVDRYNSLPFVIDFVLKVKRRKFQRKSSFVSQVALAALWAGRRILVV